MSDLSRSSLKLFLANVGGVVLGFAGIAYFAQELNPDQLGVYFLFQALLYSIDTVADFGVRGAVEKRISEGETTSRVLGSAVVMKAGLLSVPILAIVLLRGVVNGYVGSPIAIPLVAAMVLHETNQLLIRTISGQHRVGETALIDFVQRAVGIGTGAYLLLRGFGALGPVYGFLLGEVAAILLGAARVDAAVSRPTRDQVQSLFDYSRYNVVSSVGGYLYNWVDVLLIGAILSSGAVGVYEVAWRVSSVVLLLSSAVATTIFPEMSSMSAADETERIEGLITRSLVPSLYFVIPSFVGATILAPEILTYLFGVEYAAASLVLAVLMADKVTEGIQLVIGRALLAIDRPNLAARATVIGIVLNVVLNLVLIWQFGLLGAAVATFLASLVTDSLHLLYLSRFVEVRFPKRELGWLTGSALLMGALLLGIKSFVPIDSFAQLLGLVGVGALVYVCVAALSSSMRSQYRHALHAIRG